MKSIIRTDASTAIGTGHLMRCLTLAVQMKQRDIEVSFVCRSLPDHLHDLIRSNGLSVTLLDSEKSSPSPVKEGEFESWLGVSQDQDAADTLEQISSTVDWLIVDHYALDARWEKQMRAVTSHLMVIDDLANREHDCDLLLDQNLYKGSDRRYANLVPDHCQCLLGTNYAMLRKQFTTASQQAVRTRSKLHRILVFMGGVDRHNVTQTVVEAILSMSRPDIRYDVLVGNSHVQADSIARLCAGNEQIRIHQQVENMAELMAEADLAIGAGGSTTWERCCMGLPTLCVAIADHEIDIARVCRDFNVGEYLGTYHEVSCEMISQRITDLAENPDRLTEWSKNAARLIDGRGVQRVVEAIMQTTRTGAPV